ncbi:class II glutamine amidotransferase [Humidisolicoccus flavus]|uniref:class II glutamine amidotransferase n=1 Tax=Humidisolicoccus flavus TaxID=3111414 RepID=UPI00325223C0
MCRLLAFAAPDPRTATDVIGAAACREFQRMGRLHCDGWGTAWIQDGEVRRFRDPSDGTTNPDLAGALADTPSVARLTHLRLATDGMRNYRSNTHPFRVDGIALAHNGSVRPAKELRALVTEEELRRVGGETDTACLFALILRRVDAGVGVFDAVAATVAAVRSQFPSSAINLIVLTRDELIAVHANEGAPVPHKEFEESGLGDDLPRDHVDHYYQLSMRRSDDGTTVFSSSGLDTEGWERLEQNTAVRVDLHTLEITRASTAPSVVLGGDASREAAAATAPAR